jgi:hypothetical protein
MASVNLKKYIDGLMSPILTAFANSQQAQLVDQFATFESDLATLTTEVQTLTNTTNTLETDVGTLTTDVGVLQAPLEILTGITTSADSIILTSGNVTGAATAAPNASNILNLEPNTAVYVQGVIMGIDTVTLDTAAFSVSFVIKQGANAAATTIVGMPAISLIAADSALVGVGVNVAADTTYGGVDITLTNSSGWNNVTNWSANLTTTTISA